MSAASRAGTMFESLAREINYFIRTSVSDVPRGAFNAVPDLLLI